MKALRFIIVSARCELTGVSATIMLTLVLAGSGLVAFQKNEKQLTVAGAALDSLQLLSIR